MVNKMKNMNPSKTSRYHQGFFQPTNPDKYKSIDKKIIYRSSLELKFCEFCDKSPRVLKWVSEPFGIPYFHPFKKDDSNRPIQNNYYPDYYIEMVVAENKVETYLIEVKPDNFIDVPKPLPKGATYDQKRNYNYRLKTVIVNRTKAKAAQDFANKRGWFFQFISEAFFAKIARVS